MSEDLFQKAEDNLQPRDIYMRNSALVLSDGFEPKYHAGNLNIQYKHILNRTETGTATENDGATEVSISIFRVFMDLGVRIVEPKITELENQNSDEARAYVKAELTAQFIAEYQIMRNDLEEEALSQFAERNVSYHLWPFWREYVMDIFQRSRLPRVVVPTMQVQ